MCDVILDEQIKKLQQIIDESDNIVFFGGAGVSTESGLKDFRSVDGLYSLKYKFSPEEILSSNFFYGNTQEFYRFYFDKLLIDGIKPNMAHLKLVELERVGKLKAIITQNIDGLHQMAGSKVVYELHGTVNKNRCLNCNAFYGVDFIKSFNGEIPKCKCGGIIKPEVVLYGEGLNNTTINNAVNSIIHAETLIVAGTSLTVYPANSFIDYFSGKNLVLINKTETSLDKSAHLRIYGSVGEILGQIVVG